MRWIQTRSGRKENQDWMEWEWEEGWCWIWQALCHGYDKGNTSYLAMHKFEVDAFQGDLKETTLPCLHVLHWKLASQLWPYTHGEKTHCGERKKKNVVHSNNKKWTIQKFKEQIGPISLRWLPKVFHFNWIYPTNTCTTVQQFGVSKNWYFLFRKDTK